MGIFDPSNGANPKRPVNLVSRYQSQMQRAAYSPSVAQAASRSGINPTMATRVAAREVGQQMGANLPGLISQEAQMAEARRLENENKEKQLAALGLNVGGQVLGTVINAYAPGAGTAVSGLASAGADEVGRPRTPGPRVGQSALNAAPGVNSFQSNQVAPPSQGQILSAQPVSQPLVEAPVTPVQAVVQPAGYTGGAGVETPEQYQDRVRQNYAITTANESMAGRSIAPLPGQFVAPPNQAQSRRRPRSRS